MTIGIAQESAKDLGYHFPDCISPLWKLKYFSKNIFLRQGNRELQLNRLGIFQNIMKKCGQKLGKKKCIGH